MLAEDPVRMSPSDFCLFKIYILLLNYWET